MGAEEQASGGAAAALVATTIDGGGLVPDERGARDGASDDEVAAANGEVVSDAEANANAPANATARPEDEDLEEGRLEAKAAALEAKDLEAKKRAGSGGERAGAVAVPGGDHEEEQRLEAKAAALEAKDVEAKKRAVAHVDGAGAVAVGGGGDVISKEDAKGKSNGAAAASDVSVFAAAAAATSAALAKEEQDLEVFKKKAATFAGEEQDLEMTKAAAAAGAASSGGEPPHDASAGNFRQVDDDDDDSFAPQSPQPQRMATPGDIHFQASDSGGGDLSAPSSPVAAAAAAAATAVGSNDDGDGDGDDWDLPQPALETSSTGASFSSTAALPPRQVNGGSGGSRPASRRSSSSAALRRSSTSSRPGAVAVPGPGRGPSMPALSRQEVDASSLAPNQIQRLISGIEGGGGGEGDAREPQESSSLPTNEIDLIPRVEATLVSHDDDFENDEEANWPEQQHGDDSEAGGRRQSLGPSQQLRSSVSGGSQPSGPVTVNPVDYAHAVAIPADSVIPIPSSTQDATGGVGGDAATDNSEEDGMDYSYGSSHHSKAHKKDGATVVEKSCMERLFGSRRGALVAACAVLAIVALAVGLGVGLSSDDSGAGPSQVTQEPSVTTTTTTTATTSAATTAPPKPPPPLDPKRLEDIRTVLLKAYNKYLPDYKPFLEEGSGDDSYQYTALRWLAHLDPAQLSDSYEEQLTQRYAAAALYFGTGGQVDESSRAPSGGSWRSDFKFLSDQHECSWIEDMEDAGFWGPRGLACTSDRKVEVVSLYSNNLTGTFPVELAFFDHLDLLYLVDNDLRGTLPTEMGRLTSATEIMVSLNYNLEGTVPTELGYLSDNLRILSIWGNELTGTIPTELGQMTALERLTLRNCSVIGDIPEELAANSVANGGNLKEVYVQYTDMTGSMELMCPPATGDNETGWDKLEADCIEDVECSCCTDCF